MTLSQQEFKAIVAAERKRIEGDIHWGSDQHSTAMSFRTDIDSDEGYPLFLQGWYNPYSGKLSFAIVYRGVGRIYGLDLGAAHINPDGASVGETHKNYWDPGFRDKWAYEPEEITHCWRRPVEVWTQFCAEAKLKQRGILHPPRVQGAMTL